MFIDPMCDAITLPKRESFDTFKIRFGSFQDHHKYFNTGCCCSTAGNYRAVILILGWNFNEVH